MASKISTNVTLRFRNEFLKDLDELVAEEKTTRTEIIRIATRRYVFNKKRQKERDLIAKTLPKEKEIKTDIPSSPTPSAQLTIEEIKKNFHS
jgi:hypothetical protein